MISDANLAVIFVGLLSFSVLAYAILDGFDLGVGMLLPMDSADQRDQMIASIGPFWDANETWLVLAIGILLIAFPKAHSLILQTLYLPSTFMLIGLILRGVAFDFRAKVAQGKKIHWDYAFKTGSYLASFMQGYMLGIYVMGLETHFYAQCFAVLSGIGVTCAYTFIGACWLLMKTDDALQQNAKTWATFYLNAFAIGVVAVSIVNLTIHQRVFDFWTSSPYAFVLGIIPVVVFALILICKLVLPKLLQSHSDGIWLPFVIAVALFWFCFAGLAVSYYPFVIPDKLTIWETASAPESLRFILIGALIVIPCIFAYTLFSYRIFWGKASKLEYY
jgi:cytochrome d ubiquinol oxidase subunit II